MLFSLLQNAAERLQKAHKETPQLEAELLLCAVLKCKRSALILKEKEILSESEENQFEQLIQRRLASEPMAYILGYKNFWNLRITVTPDVLIPRPETEHLLEAILENKSLTSKSSLHILDLCTGSGCIPAVLASELPQAQFTVTDLCEKALLVAKKNLHFALDRSQFYCGNLFEPLPHYSTAARYDVITANPPYASETDYKDLEAEVKHEPKTAIVAENNGLAIAEQIIKTAPHYLLPEGMLFLEMGYNQAASLLQCVKETQAYATAEVRKDLAGIDRLLIAKTQ